MPATDFQNRSIHLKCTIISSTSKSLDCRRWLKGSPEQTANLCLQLFRQTGVKEISISNENIAYRVPARKVSIWPNPVICKFERQ